MLTVVVVGALVLVGAAVLVAALLTPAKLFVGLVGAGAALFVAFLVMAAVSSSGREPLSDDFSHAQLEADRLMTQQMATVMGEGMDLQMTTNGMLVRSANDSYLRALEEHVHQVDRMLGRVP